MALAVPLARFAYGCSDRHCGFIGGRYVPTWVLKKHAWGLTVKDPAGRPLRPEGFKLLLVAVLVVPIGMNTRDISTEVADCIRSRLSIHYD